MKILKIKFKNINNLKGEHQALRFDTEPLSTAGIFAITGPTGSGKSTLLDVITLSLFNKIPRYKKGISKKEIESLGSVVTHHTNEAYASVEYEIKGNRYTSEWKVAKNRNGKFKDYEMFIYDSSGKPLDLYKKDVPAKNEELIGLQYDQFVKSIILSQGEFSKFLKADKDERGQLLENITGTSIYRKIGRKVFEKNKEVKQKLETKKEILNSIQILSDEELELINKNLEKTTKDKKVKDKHIKELSDNVKIKKDLLESTKAVELLKIAATELTNKRDLLKTSLAKLEIHNKLAPVKDDIALYKDAENNRLATKKNLSEYEAQMKDAKIGFEKCLAHMGELSKKKVDAKNFMTIMRDFENEILALDKDIENSKSKGIEIRGRLNKQKENYPHELDKNPEVAISFLDERMLELKSIVSNSKIPKDSSHTENKKTLKLSQEKYNDLLLIKHDWGHLNEGKEKLTGLAERLKEQESKLKAKSPLKEKSEKLLESYQQQITTLNKRKEDAIKIASLEDHRKTLVKGEACPLCGSTDHPFSIHNLKSDFDEIENNILKLKEEIEKQQEELKNYAKTITECETNIKLLSEEIKLNKSKLLEVEQNLQLKKENYPNKNDLDEKNIEEVITKLAKEIEIFEHGIEALHEQKHAAELRILYDQLKQELHNYQEIKKLRESKFQGDKIGPVTNHLQNEFQKHNTSITRLSEAIEKESKDLNRALKSLDKHKSKLKPKLESLGFSSIEEMSQNFLEEVEANQILSQENELKKLFTENETKYKTHQSKIAQLTSLDTVQNKSLEALEEELSAAQKERDQYTELIGELNNQIKTDKETKERQKDQTKEIADLVAETEKWSLLNKMIGDANGNKFANYSQGLTLQNLLVFANHRLKNLSERYLLDIPKDGGPLRVVDLFQGNTHRAVSTLSGGESFLISLALALSLSDMASRNVSLESLFIDEGFGTLDQETLDVAMTTLEKLQSENQKMVGVISHVEALKERITVQIKLEKNAQGFSNVTVVQN